VTGDGGRYADGSPVLVRFPLTPEQEAGPRDAWPWLPGTVISQCGPDEWDVMVVVRELATLDDGSPAPTRHALGRPVLSVRLPGRLRAEASARVRVPVPLLRG